MEGPGSVSSQPHRLNIDGEALVAIKRSVTRCIGKCGRRVRHEAADILSEVLARMAVYEPKMVPVSLNAIGGLAWQYTWRVIHETYRAEQRRAKLLVPLVRQSQERDGAAGVFDNVADPSAKSPEESMNQADAAKAIHEVMAQLNPIDRQIIQHALLDSPPLSRQEIANTIGMTEGAVRVRLHRAIVTLANQRKLRDLLSDDNTIGI